MGARAKVFEMKMNGETHVGTVKELAKILGISDWTMKMYIKCPPEQVESITWLNKTAVSKVGAKARNDLLVQAVSDVVLKDDMTMLYDYCIRYDIRFPKRGVMKMGAYKIALLLNGTSDDVKSEARRRLTHYEANRCRQTGE